MAASKGSVSYESGCRLTEKEVFGKLLISGIFNRFAWKADFRLKWLVTFHLLNLNIAKFFRSTPYDERVCEHIIPPMFALLAIKLHSNHSTCIPC